MNIIYLSFISRIIKNTAVVLFSCFWFYIFFIHVLGLCVFVCVCVCVCICVCAFVCVYVLTFLCMCVLKGLLNMVSLKVNYLPIGGKFDLKQMIYCTYLEKLLPRSKNLCYPETCLTHEKIHVTLNSIISRLYDEFFWLSNSWVIKLNVQTCACVNTYTKSSAMSECCYLIFKNAQKKFNPLNTELNPICHLLALLGAHHILHVSRIRFK